MDRKLENPSIITLEINDETYRGDLHSSIGPALAYGANGNNRYPDTSFPEIRVDSIREETAVSNDQATVEDWLLTDEEEELHYLVQGKSYGETISDIEYGAKQLYDFATEFEHFEPSTYDRIKDLFLVVTQPSGVRNPRTDFTKVEEGIEEAVRKGDSARIHAEIYRFEPPSIKDYPFDTITQ